MVILDNQISLNDISKIEDHMYFESDEMVKEVADIDKGIIALNAELHSDFENMLLEIGSDHYSLYGFNIYYDGEIKFDTMINPLRNREAG